MQCFMSSVSDVKCEEPPNVSHAKWIDLSLSDSYSYRPFPYYEGNKIQYYCEAGYRLIGESTVICRENGLWSHPPACVNAGKRIIRINQV